MLLERLWAIGWGGYGAAAYGGRVGRRGGRLQLFVLHRVNTFSLCRIAVTYSTLAGRHLGGWAERGGHGPYGPPPGYATAHCISNLGRSTNGRRVTE